MSFVAKRRPLSRAGLAAAAVTAVLGGGLVCLAGPASATTTDIHGVVLSEVESNGDSVHGDWIELHNETGDTVDLSGAILSDNQNTDEFVIPAGTLLAPDGYIAFTVDGPGGFGLGGADEARLFTADTTDLANPARGQLVDSFSWSSHATVTYGRNPADPTDPDAWEQTSASTFGAPNQFSVTVPDISSVRINEVESNGDSVHGDWIELYNTSASSVDLSGAILSDNQNDDAFVIPSGTTIAGHGFQAFQVDGPEGFGLGAADSARLFPAGTTDLAAATPVDSTSWTSHATVTWGRVPDGTGAFGPTTVSTFDASNVTGSFPADDLSHIKLDEVKTTGDNVHGDWVELHNTSGAAVDISNAILSDDSNSHIIRIPAGTTIAANGYYAIRTDDPALSSNFGLGDADSIRLFNANLTDLTGQTPVDQFSWTQHQPTSWGVNASGAWAETNKATFGAANDFTSTITPDLSWVVLNEIESNGDTTHGDWVELHNTAGVAIDISGAILSDSDNTHALAIPAGTTIAGGGYYAIRVDDPAVTGNFGLGSDDAVRLYAPGATVGTSIPLDHEEWANHSDTTLGRTFNGLGDWADTAVSTYDAANQF